MFLLLLACTPLSGDWSGDIRCGGYAMDVDLTLEWSEGEYQGEGTLDCTDALGYECEQTFDIQIEADGFLGEQDLEVDLDDCSYDAGFASGDVTCDNPENVVWDGADAIEGAWADCDLDLERDT